MTTKAGTAAAVQWARPRKLSVSELLSLSEAEFEIQTGIPPGRGFVPRKKFAVYSSKWCLLDSLAPFFSTRACRSVTLSILVGHTSLHNAGSDCYLALARPTTQEMKRGMMRAVV